MARRQIPDAALLRSLLEYEQETGRFYWKDRPVSMFKNGAHTAAHNCAAWNKKYSGREAFTALNHSGYKIGAVLGKIYLAHRIAWMMFYRSVPEIIDHINGDPSDNRIANLRSATQHENMRNAKRSRVNKSGFTGVSWHKQASKWRAYITVDGRQNSLGLFERQDEAAEARRVAGDFFGFHVNHGRPS